MAGCFGNSEYDRYLEQQLDEYLDKVDPYTCPNCGYEADCDDLIPDEEDEVYCKECGEIV